MLGFGSKTVDGVLKALVNAVADLEDVREQQNAEVEIAGERIRQQTQIRDNAVAEALRAQRVAAKLRELIE